MTGPPNNPDAAYARLSERVDSLIKDIAALDRLTDSRFVTHRTLLDSQAAQTALALAASDKLTTQAFASSEKAIEKAENSQKEYNARSNEFRSALDDANKLNISRVEFEGKHIALEERLSEFKKDFERYKDSEATALSRTVGRDEWNSTVKETATWRESVNAWRAGNEGKDAGLAPFWSAALAIGGALGLFLIERAVIR